MTSRQPQDKRLRTGELAALTGVSTDTLRHYERKGVLPRPQRTESGYRQYPIEAVVRVGLVRKALDIGLTLDELATILGTRDRGGIPCQEVRDLAEEKLTALEARLRELVALRDALRETLNAWDTQLAQTPAGEHAHLLEGLEARTMTGDAVSSSRAKGFPNEHSILRPRGSRGHDPGRGHD